MVIVDASVMVNALAMDGAPGERARAALGADDAWAAPEHMPMEAFSAVRGLCLGGKLPEQRAREVLEALSEEIEVELIGVRRLFPLMWPYRGNVSGYDAAYAATALFLDSPVLTSDVRLAKAIAGQCPVTVV